MSTKSVPSFQRSFTRRYSLFFVSSSFFSFANCSFNSVVAFSVWRLACSSAEQTSNFPAASSLRASPESFHV